MSEEKKETLIGKIIHYFDNIKVAVIVLKDELKIGDQIRIKGGKTTNFTQEIESLENNYQKIKKANKGDEVGLKVKKKVREGYKIYKIE